MKNRADIINELRELNSPLADFPAGTPFAVPAHYFAAAPARLRSGIDAAAAAADPELLLSRHNPYIVPQGYFDQLPSRLLAAAVDEEAPVVLPQIGSAFAVPEGYFSSLPAELLRKAKEANGVAEVVPQTQRQGRTIRMPFLRPALRFAAAAVVLLGIGLGSYRILNTGSASGNASRQLARLDKSELYRYVQQNIDDFDEDVLTVANAGSAAAVTGVELDLEEQDIIDYLDQNGWDTEEDLATDL